MKAKLLFLSALLLFVTGWFTIASRPANADSLVGKNMRL